MSFISLNQLKSFIPSFRFSTKIDVLPTAPCLRPTDCAIALVKYENSIEFKINKLKIPISTGFQVKEYNGEKIFCSIMEENPLIVAFDQQRGNELSLMLEDQHAYIGDSGRLYYGATHKKDKWIPFSLRKKRAYISPSVYSYSLTCETSFLLYIWQYAIAPLNM